VGDDGGINLNFNRQVIIFILFFIFKLLKYIQSNFKVDMATTSIKASNLFEVNGLVAVITGGGSGIYNHLHST